MNYNELKHKRYAILDLTTLTNEEFECLVPPFEEAFIEYMTHWRMDGLPRTARRYTVYKNCPLPTPEQRLLFILSYLKTNPLQAYHGAAFGLPQCKTSTWIHLLLKVLSNTLRHLGDTPSRNIQELVQRITDLIHNEPVDQLAALVEEKAPLLPMTEPNVLLAAPKIRLNRKRLTAGSKNGTPKKISS